MLRSHTCGELSKKDVKKPAKLCGWVNSRRDHGGVIFIDLRDRYGLTQVVFDPSHNKEVHKQAERLGREDVLFSEGKVRLRPKGMMNEKLKTGEIEVLVDELRILNKAETPPIEIDDRVEAGEETRLKYRYLDLRRPKMQSQLLFRHKLSIAVREYLNSVDFVEIETPMLIKTTPEGARDYLVPSRVSPGKFYSLPQSPQIYKQILMIAGFDRYYQLARCLRDEDLRADRQPEHTQVDLEMSFAEAEDIFKLTEGLMKHVFKKLLKKEIKTPFKRLTYNEAMERFCTDKPDIRFGMECCTATDIAKDSQFKVFLDVIANGGIVKLLNAQNCGEKLSRNQIDELIEFAKQNGAQGLAWMKVTKNGLESNIAKFFPQEVQKRLIERAKAKENDLLLFAADTPKTANDVLSKIRLRLGDSQGLIKDGDFGFCFVTDFPMFEWNEDEQKWDFAHNPFTLPREGYWEKMEQNPGEVISYQYDFVINGSEIFSGSVRNYMPELQMRTFKITGMSETQIKDKFGFLLEAYKYGAPIHAGFGLGFDRLAALMQGIQDIREVIAFPKNKKAESLMDNAPSPADEKQLAELHIRLDVEQVSVFEKLAELLDKKDIKYEVLEHKAVYTSEEAANVRGTKLKQGARALLLECSGRFVLSVTSAEKEVDMEKLKAILGAKKIRLANPKEVERVTKCTVGAVPPFGNLFGIETIVDKSLMENEIIAFNAGSHVKSIKMNAQDYIKTANPRIESFSK